MSGSPVVLDTNVFIAAAFKPASDSGRVIASVRSGSLRLVWNEPTRRETEALLRKIPPISWEAMSDLFQERDRWNGAANGSAFLAVEDPDDRKFVALAASAGATLLSLDRHLLDAPLEGACLVQSPGQFLRR